MLKHVFINRDNLKAILDGDKAALRKPVGFCYEDNKPRTIFVGTQLGNKDELQLTKGGDIQFNLKEAKGEQKASEGEEVNLQEPAEAQAAAEGQEAQGDKDVDWGEYAQERAKNNDIPF